MRDLTQESPGFSRGEEVDGHTASGLVGDDGSAQRDPFVRIARALEVCAMASALKVARGPGVRERAWRTMLALMEEIEGDACGPQDVVGR